MISLSFNALSPVVAIVKKIPKRCYHYCDYLPDKYLCLTSSHHFSLLFSHISLFFFYLKEEVKPVAAVAKPVVAAAPKKKTPAQLAREKEEAERKQRADQARRRAQEAEAARKASNDPNYTLNKKEAERLAVLESEAALASDLFGTSISPSTPAPVKELTEEEKEMRAQAARLAAATGLSDGADGMDSINDPNAKTAGVAPNPLDTVDFSTKEKVVEYSTKIVEKMNSITVTGASTEFLKTLINGIGPNMKVDDLSEIMRVLTVVKNDANKALQNKKKKSKGKPTLKAIGSAYDDYDDFDGGFGRNDADADFF